MTNDELQNQTERRYARSEAKKILEDSNGECRLLCSLGFLPYLLSYAFLENSTCVDAGMD